MKVSVIIPTHNRAAFLREAVMSALNQTWRDLEVVIVDDGSTDYTAEVVRGIQDSRVRFLRQENRGVSAALNTGWRAAQGEYVARLDSDDAWLPNLLTELVPQLEKDPRLGVAYARARWMDAQGRPLPQILGAPLKFPRQVLASLLYGDSVCPIAVVLRKSALERAGGYDESLIGNEDWDLWLRVALNSPFRFHNAILARYRSHPGNLTASGSSRFRQLIADRIRVLDKFYARPSLPPEALRMKPIAYRNLYQDIAIRHLSIGQWPLAFDYMARAVRAAPDAPLFLFRSVGVIVYYLFLSKTGWGVRLVSAISARRNRAA